MGAGEVILILFVYLMLFGAKGVPALAQTMGKAMYQFRNASKDIQKEIMDSAAQIQKEANIKLDQIDLGLDDDAPPRPRTASVQVQPPAESIPAQSAPSEPAPMVIPQPEVNSVAPSSSDAAH
jgi:sec-independent protein translocase protein TatA